MWGDGRFGCPQPQSMAPGGHSDAIAGGVIGGTIIGGMPGSGSSALASMLGINLPTGSGSLRESSNLWVSSAPPSQPPIAALNGNSAPVSGLIGDNGGNLNNGFIGGVAIGGNHRSSDAFGGGGGGSSSDIALLQSLLPGVHITNGGAGGSFGGIGTPGVSEWNSISGQQTRSRGSGVPIGGDNHQQGVNLQSSLGGRPIGQNQRAPGSIW
jgi:hypothetical protein